MVFHCKAANISESFLKRLWVLYSRTLKQDEGKEKKNGLSPDRTPVADLFDRILPLLNGQTTVECLTYANEGQWKSLNCKHMVEQPASWRRVKFTAHLHFHRKVKSNPIAYKLFILLYLVWMLNCLTFGGDLQALLANKDDSESSHLIVNYGMRMLQKVI